LNFDNMISNKNSIQQSVMYGRTFFRRRRARDVRRVAKRADRTRKEREDHDELAASG
jgi:hypothetical protein